MTDDPIAQPNSPGFWQRLQRWIARHNVLCAVAISALLTGLLVGGGCFAWVAHDRAMRRAATAAEIQAALHESKIWLEQGQLPEALSAARRAHALLNLPGANPAVTAQVRSRLGDLELLDQLEQIRLQKRESPDSKAANRQYEQASQGHDSDAKVQPAK